MLPGKGRHLVGLWILVIEHRHPYAKAGLAWEAKGGLARAGIDVHAGASRGQRPLHQIGRDVGAIVADRVLTDGAGKELPCRF